MVTFDKEITVQVIPRQEFDLLVTPTSVTLKPGESADLNVTGTRKNGYAQSIHIAIQNLPAGVTPAPAILDVAQHQAQLTIAAASTDATLGRFTASVIATGPDVNHTAIIRSQPLALTGNLPPPPMGTYTNENPQSDHAILYSQDHQWKVEASAFNTKFLFFYHSIGSSVEIEHFNSTSRDWESKAADYITITNIYRKEKQMGSLQQSPKEARNTSSLIPDPSPRLLRPGRI